MSLFDLIAQGKVEEALNEITTLAPTDTKLHALHPKKGTPLIYEVFSHPELQPSDKNNLLQALAPSAQLFINNNKHLPLAIGLSAICLIHYTSEMHRNTAKANTQIRRNFLNANLYYRGLAALTQTNNEAESKLIQKAWAELYYFTGIYYAQQNKFDDAYIQFKQATFHHEKSQDHSAQALSLYNQTLCLGNLNQNKDLPAMETLLKTALNLLEPFTDQNTWKSRCEYYLGMCLTKQNKHQEALQYFDKAVTHYETKKDVQAINRQASFLIKQSKLFNSDETNKEKEQNVWAKQYQELAAKTTMLFHSIPKLIPSNNNSQPISHSEQNKTLMYQ